MSESLDNFMFSLINVGQVKFLGFFETVLNIFEAKHDD
jgi:hypothetical protein